VPGTHCCSALSPSFLPYLYILSIAYSVLHPKSQSSHSTIILELALTSALCERSQF
jgi:hypothetical protein